MSRYRLVVVPWRHLARSFSFSGKLVGTSFTGCVTRAISHEDIRPQTDLSTGCLRVSRDGSPRWVMLVPLALAPDPGFPDGRATWYVKGSDWKALDQAMTEAGVTPVRNGMIPEAGAQITITYTGDRLIRSVIPLRMKAVTYQRPGLAL